MRTEQLKYLVDVAETKSMSRTAERMFVSPQAISKGIKQLEQELGAELLVRTSSGVTLTPLGESVVAVAQNMLKEEQLLGHLASQSKQRKILDDSFPIRICSTSAVVNMVLPDIIAKFQHVNINIVPRIYMVNSRQEVLEHVEQGLCDLGLITYNEEALFNYFAPYQDILDMNLLARDELVVVMDNRAYRPGQLSVADEEFRDHLCSMYCVLPIEEWTKSSDNLQVMRSNDADFHRAMIKKTNAYVLMPRLAYQHFFGSKSFVALPLENNPASLLHAAIYRKDAPEELRRFASLIQVGLQ